MTTFEGAVMVADISGFTRLTEQLSRGLQTAFGVELLTKCMNNYFSKVCAYMTLPLGEGFDKQIAYQFSIGVVAGART